MEKYICRQCAKDVEPGPGFLTELIKERFCSLRCMVENMSIDIAERICSSTVENSMELHESQCHGIDY